MAKPSTTKTNTNQLLGTFLKTSNICACLRQMTTFSNYSVPHSLDLLPIRVLQQVLRFLLVVHGQALILYPDTSAPLTYRTHLQPSVLRVSRRFYQVGLPLLYGDNIVTSSSPSASVDFDAHLCRLPGRNRQLIKNITLNIDWASQLWTKFPLIARQIGELKSLQQLEINIVHSDTRRGVPVLRDGRIGALMLKSEMKVFNELIGGLNSLRVFRLEGFSDERFATALMDKVNVV